MRSVVRRSAARAAPKTPWGAAGGQRPDPATTPLAWSHHQHGAALGHHLSDGGAEPRLVARGVGEGAGLNEQHNALRWGRCTRRRAVGAGRSDGLLLLPIRGRCERGAASRLFSRLLCELPVAAAAVCCCHCCRSRHRRSQPSTQSGRSSQADSTGRAVLAMSCCGGAAGRPVQRRHCQHCPQRQRAVTILRCIVPAITSTPSAASAAAVTAAVAATVAGTAACGCFGAAWAHSMRHTVAPRTMAGDRPAHRRRAGVLGEWQAQCANAWSERPRYSLCEAAHS